MIRLRPIWSDPLPTSRAVFWSDGAILDVRSDLPGLEPSCRSTVDLLTLSFAGPGHVLRAMDAHTPLMTEWRQVPIDLPTPDGEAVLQAAGAFDANGVGRSFDAAIEYHYDAFSGVLRLLIGEKPVRNRYRCMSGVICGLAASSRLAEVLIVGLELR